MAKNREGSINLFGAVQAKTEDGIVAHADGIAVEYDENGKPIKTLEQAIADGSLGGNKKTNRPVPNTGFVEKVYLNTSLSDEEVESILNTLTYNEDGQVNVLGVGTASNPIMLLGFLNMEGMQAIVDVVTRKAYWANETFVSTVGSNFGVTTSSWQTFTNPIEVNAEVASEVFGNPIGSQNDKLSQIISIDPFIGGTPKLSLVWDDLFDLSLTKEKFNNIDITEELYEQVKSANKLEVEISNSTKDMKINLVLQTTQIEEQDKMIKLGLTTDKYFIEVGLQLLDNETSGHILFQFREILGVIDVEELPPAIFDTSTAVPNTGLVEKVYFNTSLSVEEVESIFNDITPSDVTDGIESLLVVPSDDDLNPTYNLYLVSFEEGGIKCTALLLVSPSNTSGELLWCNNNMAQMMGLTAGWQTFDSPIEINGEGISEYHSFPVGSQNDKLKQLISITPFEEPNTDIEVDKLYRTPIKTGGEWIGTIVPDSGTVEKVYLNTSLSDEEISNILSQLAYDEGAYYPVATDSFVMLVVHMDGTNGYALGNANTGEMYWANQEVIDISGMPLSAGWQSFTNPIEINGVFVKTSTEGEQNHKLTSLISTTPFVKSGGEVVGYKYHQFANGEWKELGSGGEVELPKDLPVVIEKAGALFTDVSFTDDDWELILNNKIVIINVKNTVENIVLTDSLYTKQIYNAIESTIYFIGYHADGTAYRYAVTKDTTDGIIKINKVFEEVNYITFGDQVDYIGLQVYGGNPNNSGLQTVWKATTITSDSNRVATSKAVYDFVTNYMQTNYGNGDTEEF